MIGTDERVELTIYSSTGQRIGGPVVIEADQTISENMSALSAGLYIFRFTGKNRSFSRKIVVR